MGILKFRLL